MDREGNVEKRTGAVDMRWITRADKTHRLVWWAVSNAATYLALKDVDPQVEATAAQLAAPVPAQMTVPLKMRLKLPHGTEQRIQRRCFA